MGEGVTQGITYAALYTAVLVFALFVFFCGHSTSDFDFNHRA